MTPAGIVGLVHGLNSIQLQNMDISGKQGVINAVRNGYDENGQPSPGLIKDLATQGGVHAQGAIGEATTNMKARLELGQTKNNMLLNGFSSIAAMPKPTTQNVHDLSARMVQIPGMQEKDTLAYRNYLLKDNNPAGIRRRAMELAQQYKGIGAVEPVQGGVTAQNQPSYVPSGQFGYGTLAPGGAVNTAPPGSPESQKIRAEESEKRGAELSARADTVPQRMADLSVLEHELEIAGPKFGPWIASEKKLNQITNRIAGFNVSMTPEEVAATENFEKIANNIALNQAGALGITDQRVSTSMGANPNVHYSYLGNKGIIPILKGNEDAIKTKANAWNDFKANPANRDVTYTQFSRQFNQGFDPRVFQMHHMTPDQQDKFLANIPKKDQQSLARKVLEYQKIWLDTGVNARTSCGQSRRSGLGNQDYYRRGGGPA